MKAQSATNHFVEQLSKIDKHAAVEVLASAFHEYPVMRYVLKDAGSNYEEQLREMIGFFVESRLTREWPLLGIRVEDELAAVAAANSPDAKPRPKSLQETYIRMCNVIGKDAANRLQTFERLSSELTPGTPHYYLGMIGVRPQWQGKGLARILVDHLHEMSASDPRSSGVCLSTENPANVPLYQHLGYRIIGEADVDELHTWAMFWQNRHVGG